MFYFDVWDAHLYISKYNLQNFIILLSQNKSNIINVWYVYQTENIMEINWICKDT